MEGGPLVYVNAYQAAGLVQRLSSKAESVSFDVQGNRVGDAGAEALAAALRDANCKLHTLNIAGNRISVAGAEALAAALRDANCKLHTLNIARNRISVAGAEALAAALRDANCKLHTLHIASKCERGACA
ncbi:hypothetical protein CYMTET_7208 [Cymbomonas tetramitiformis]|uniref:Uncharacterized protein n=1 Tax=Cymbomonas tetramitiformis TaxID=36881 RepID=A0AAE0LHP2_9CHLO|nr:hypothetical protein CYMTET_7208 [Cymbomonas tetramitiformis]